MNRADFLKRLGLGTIGVAVAPKIIGDLKEAPLKVKEPTIAETDTYCIATTEEPDYMIGVDPYVGDCVRHSNMESLYKLDEILWIRTEGFDNFKHYPVKVVDVNCIDGDIIYTLCSAKGSGNKNERYFERERILKNMVGSNIKPY